MQIIMIGLGKMGRNLALQMIEKEIPFLGAYDASPEARAVARSEGIPVMESLDEFFKESDRRKVFWLMVPAGTIVDQVINEILPGLQPGDIVIDGGNSHYKDSLKRYEFLKEKKIHFADAGTSGGIEGARNGSCLMVGAEKEVNILLEPWLSRITVPGGYLHTGSPGSGHYVKMIHNGIEYGMMQAIGEGFQLLEQSPFSLNFGDVARVWSNGSVIRGWLMELTQAVFQEDPQLSNIKDIIESSGEGLWMVEEALKRKVPVPVISTSLYTRFASEQEESFSNKVVAGLRNQFGGHYLHKKTEVDS